jgi:hypothetical protein
MKKLFKKTMKYEKVNFIFHSLLRENLSKKRIWSLKKNSRSSWIPVSGNRRIRNTIFTGNFFLSKTEENFPSRNLKKMSGKRWPYVIWLKTPNGINSMFFPRKNSRTSLPINRHWTSQTIKHRPFYPANGLPIQFVLFLWAPHHRFMINVRPISQLWSRKWINWIWNMPWLVPWIDFSRNP